MFGGAIGLVLLGLAVLIDVTSGQFQPGWNGLVQAAVTQPIHWLIYSLPPAFMLAGYAFGQHRMMDKQVSFADRERQEVDRRYRTLLDGLDAGVVLQDATGAIIACNHAATRILGLTFDQMIGRTSIDPRWRAVHEDGSDFPGTEHPAMVSLQTGQPQTNVSMGVHKPDDTLTWISINARPLIREGETKPYAVVVSFIDTTTAREIEANRANSEARLASIVELAADAVISTDEHFRIELFNRSAERIFGYEASEVKGLSIQQLVPPRFVERHGEHLNGYKNLEAGNRRMGEYREVVGFHKDGSEFPIEASIGRTEVNGRKLFNVILRDIRERRQILAALATNEERFRELVTHAPVGIFQIAADQGILFANDMMAAIAGHTPAVLATQRVGDILHPDDRGHIGRAWRGAVGAGRTFEAEFRIIRPEGETRWVSVTTVPVRDVHGRVLSYYGTVSDITEKRLAETELQEANIKLTTWLAEIEQRAQEMTLLNEMTGMLQGCMTIQEACDVFRFSAERLFAAESGALSLLRQGESLLETVVVWGDHDCHQALFSKTDCWALRRGRMHVTDPGRGASACAHFRADVATNTVCIPLQAQGETVGVLHLAQPAEAGPFADTRIQLAQTVADSVALALANIRLRESLRNQSIRDPLTGLFNRRYLEETLARELHQAERSERPLAVIMLDVDYFKRFNDTYGHGAGDELLRKLGALLLTQVRGGDIACRYGGEEFALIMPGATQDVALRRAERIRQEVQALRLVIDGDEVGSLSISSGVAALGAGRQTPGALLGAADSALYEAKRAGRNRVFAAAGA
jgi:diguanylate cyclase (GGDEF)-like protein/PAS domain S-box-containing protein